MRGIKRRISPSIILLFMIFFTGCINQKIINQNDTKITFDSSIRTTTVKNPENEEESNVIVFNDPELEKRIREIISKPEGEINEEDINEINEIYIFGVTTNPVRRYSYHAEDELIWFEYEDEKGNVY